MVGSGFLKTIARQKVQGSEDDCSSGCLGFQQERGDIIEWRVAKGDFSRPILPKGVLLLGPESRQKGVALRSTSVNGEAKDAVKLLKNVPGRLIALAIRIATRN
jgi:hypothetical protein